MWYVQDPKGFRQDELLELYKIVEKRERGFREDLFRFTNFYSAVCYAILALTFSGFISLYSKGMVTLCLILGPLMTLWMCLLGLRVTKSIYRRIMREVSMKAKLENALGLDRAMLISEFLGEKAIWQNDTSLIPNRHAEKRLACPTSDDFIESFMKSGFYRDNHTYFTIIACFSVILAVAIAFVSFCPIK